MRKCRSLLLEMLDLLRLVTEERNTNFRFVLLLSYVELLGDALISEEC